MNIIVFKYSRYSVMETLEIGSEVVFIGISLTDVEKTWEEEISHRCDNFPEDYKKMLLTINTHKHLKLNYTVGKLKVVEVNKNEALGIVLLGTSTEKGTEIISTKPGFWLAGDTEFVEYKHLKKELRPLLGSGHTFLEEIIGSLGKK